MKSTQSILTRLYVIAINKIDCGGIHDYSVMLFYVNKILENILLIQQILTFSVQLQILQINIKMQKKQVKPLNALIYGATGAVGRELVKTLVASSRWSKIVLVVRNQLQQWATLQNKNKLQIEKIQNLDKLQQTNKWKYSNIDSVFCCLGSRVGQGQDTFKKVDKIYPLWIADIAKSNGIKHYGLVSSGMTNPNSWFLYMRVKGQVERDLKKKELEKLSIFKPGFLMNRFDPRFGEKILKWVPFIPKIDVKTLAKCMMIQAQRNHDNEIKSNVNQYGNRQILEFFSV